jgi:hypothetical protein
VTRVQHSRWAWIALTTLLIATGAGLYYLTRGTTFSYDEWTWIITRRGNDVATFLRSYDGHFSLIPIAIYRLLFATAGLGDYRPYRLLVIAAHLLCVALVFVYASRRVGSYLGICGAALVLFLGAGWQDILWPFQMAWLISMAAGVGALLMLDRRDREGDVVGCVLLAASLSSSGVGAVVAAGLVVDVLWGRRQMRDIWIVATPLALYGLWWLAYEHAGPLGQISLVPHFVANIAAATLSGLTGCSGNTLLGGSGTLLTWGRPLALVAIGLAIWRLIYLRRVPPRVLTLLTMLLSFWFLTGLTRTLPHLGLSQSWASRYLYVGGLFVVLLAAELARGVSVSLAARLLLGAGVAAAVFSNIGTLSDAASEQRLAAQFTRADLGALQIGSRLVGRNYVVSYLPGYPLLQLRAGSYFAAARALGTPAAMPSEISTQPDMARQVADRELLRIHHIELSPVRSELPPGARPVVELAIGGAVARRGPCITFRPVNGNAASAGKELELEPASGGLRLTAEHGSGTVSIRRFAQGVEPLGTLSASRPATLQIAPDLAAETWHVQIVATAAVSACGLR